MSGEEDGRAHPTRGGKNGRMKKAICCTLLALVLVMAGPQLALKLRAAVIDMIDHGASVNAQTAPVLATGTLDMMDATLYFRFGQTDVLGAEQTQLDVRRDETVARLIVEQLIDGPRAEREKLHGVFPQGTALISVNSEGSTAFVTLNRAFLGKPDGAPANWEDLTYWQEEAALRRRLAVQSIVLALTEDGRYQRVQFYVADSDDDLPARIEMAWFEPDITDGELVLSPCGRDESMLLTPNRAMNMILDAWQRRDWLTLYTLLDTQDASQMPSYSVFEAEMERLDVTLLTYALSAGSVDLTGKKATLVLDAQIRSRTGGDAQIIREAVPLSRVADNWSMTPETLRSLMVRD